MQNIAKRLLICLLIVIPLGFPVNADNKTILRCADVHVPGYPTVASVLYMSHLVKTETKGRIEIVVYPNGALGSEKSVVEMVRLGALEMGRVSASEVVEVDPELEVFLLPYIFRDADHQWKVLNGPIGNHLLERMSQVDLIGLCFLESGYRSFYNSKQPIYRPTDLQGLKIRVQPSKLMVRLIEFTGATAVPIDFNEVYSALAIGAIDGAENNLPSFLTSGHYKKARYYSFDRHSSIPEVVLFSKKVWLKLSRSDQAIIREAAKKASGYERNLWDNYENESFQKLQQEGCQFNEVDLEAFKQWFKPFYRMYSSKYQSIITEIRRVD